MYISHQKYTKNECAKLFLKKIKKVSVFVHLLSENGQFLFWQK